MNSAPAQSPFISGAALVSLAETSGCFLITGADAFDYLQRQLSNDLKKLSDARGLLSTLMTRKGKMVGAFDLYRYQGGFLFVCERSALGTLAETLEKLVILEQVTVARGEALGELLSVQGPEAARVLGSAFGGVQIPGEEYGAAITEVRGKAMLIARRRRSRVGGFDLLVPAVEVAQIRAELVGQGAEPVDLAAAEAARIDAGIPRFGVDADGGNLPPESGYESAISYSKGCYVGQEVVARIRTYGHVNQLLRVLRCAGGVQAPVGAEVLKDGTPVGRVTSSALSPIDGQPVALAYLKHDMATAGGKVTVVGPSGNIEASIQPLS